MLLSLHYVAGYKDVAPMELELTEILKKRNLLYKKLLSVSHQFGRIRVSLHGNKANRHPDENGKIKEYGHSGCHSGCGASKAAVR